MEQVNGVLQAVVAKLGGQAKEKFWTAWLYTHWASIVGADIAAQTQAERIQRGVLIIVVTNSVWQHHLTLMKPDLVSKLSRQTNGLVKDIRFLSGVLDKKTAVVVPETTIRLEALSRLSGWFVLMCYLPAFGGKAVKRENQRDFARSAVVIA